jgi:uncharacterized protein YkwD
MPWTRVVLVLVLATTIAAASATEPASAAPQIIRKINKVRGAHGLPALRYSPSLGRSSQRYARKLMKLDVFRHAPRIQASRGFRRLGECLAMTPGWRLKRSGVIRSWLHSPGHRAILLSRGFNRVGAAPARGRFWGRPSTIWVAQFGRS